MGLLISGLVVFFATHVFSALRSRAPGRDLKERLGHGPYMGLYSLFALAGLVLIIYGYGAARPATVLYTPPVWAAHLNYLFSLLAFILLSATYLPLGHLKRHAKHPRLAAVKLWAAGHLLANGEPNSIILVGSFLAYGVIARIAAKRRGDDGPGRAATASLTWDGAAVLIGLGVYGAILFWLHPVLFGVSIWPVVA